MQTFLIPTIPHRESFGQRQAPPRQFACSQNCGSPACVQGCTLLARKRQTCQDHTAPAEGQSHGA